MKFKDAIIIAQSYAESWDIKCDEFTEKSKVRLWYCPIIFTSFTLEFKSDLGKGLVVVLATKEVYMFEYQPNDKNSDLLPLWVVFPSFPSSTIGWRQSSGEIYSHKWFEWYFKLTKEKALQYQKRFPEPENEALNWTGYYEAIEERNVRA